MSNSINTLFGYSLADSKARSELDKKIDKPVVEGTEGQILQVVKNTDTDKLEIEWVDSGGAIGGLENLTTSNKTSVVAAVNELDSDIGDKFTLSTTEKGSLVGAVNELDSDKIDVPTNTNTEGQVLMVYDDSGTKKAKYMDLTFATTSEVEALFD